MIQVSLGSDALGFSDETVTPQLYASRQLSKLSASTPAHFLCQPLSGLCSPSVQLLILTRDPFVPYKYGSGSALTVSM